MLGRGARFLMKVWRGSAVAGLVSLAMIGCSDFASDAPEPTVRDSTGISIVENHARSPANSEWLIGATQVEIGRAVGEGPDLFGSIRQVIRLEGGQIAVADQMALEIRVFGNDGTHQVTIGRRGEGPGEFSSLWWIGVLPGDSIAAVDPLGGRVSMFSREGGFARSFALPRIQGGLAPNVVGALRDGTLVVSTLTVSPSQDTRTQSTILIYTVGLEGQVVGRVGEYPDRDLGGNGLAVGFGGHAIVASGDFDIWYGHSGGFSLHGLDRHGTVRRIVRLERTRRQVTEREVTQARAALEGSLVRQGAAGPLMQRILDTEFAEVHPVHGRVLVDQLGFLWVANYEIPSRGSELPDSPEAWDVFDAEGRWRTQLVMPSGFRLSEVGEAFILGVCEDEMGVQRVYLYDLDRGEEFRP
jgi:hypothetical protein